MKDKACSFTGHRCILPSDRLYIKNRLKEEILKLIKAGYTDFLCGGALGFDMMAAMEVLYLKNEYPKIRLVLTLPCRGWNSAWSENNKRIYSEIVDKADETMFISNEYMPGCMQKRNRYLIDNSSRCIAFFDGRRGGTAYTVSYALKEGLELTNVKTSDNI